MHLSGHRGTQTLRLLRMSMPYTGAGFGKGVTDVSEEKRFLWDLVLERPPLDEPKFSSWTRKTGQFARMTQSGSPQEGILSGLPRATRTHSSSSSLSLILLHFHFLTHLGKT